jgi:hypothetical protein
MVDGFPGLIVDPEGCRLLREGLGGLFHYAKIRAGLASREAELPAKNHPQPRLRGRRVPRHGRRGLRRVRGRRAAARQAAQPRQTEAISD